jgi:cation diffusion facilitator CzcD-associated flavoprotein CzcO
VEDVVHDVDTARKLQAWYPGWCKRPCFHDEYLPTFNRENVTLVDMDGKGVETMTEKAIVAVGKEWEVDVVKRTSTAEWPLCMESRAGDSRICSGLG